MRMTQSQVGPSQTTSRPMQLVITSDVVKAIQTLFCGVTPSLSAMVTRHVLFMMLLQKRCVPWGAREVRDVTWLRCCAL